MIHLTDRARRFVGYAVNQFGNHDQQRVWYHWASGPQLSIGPYLQLSSAPALPRDVAAVALTVLMEYGKLLDRRIEKGEDNEDAISDMENDLSFVEAISRELTAELKNRQMA